MGQKRAREGEGRAIPAAAAAAAKAAAARKPAAQAQLPPVQQYAGLLADVRKQIVKAPVKARARYAAAMANVPAACTERAAHCRRRATRSTPWARWAPPR